MPTVTTYQDHPTLPYVRVVADWSDALAAYPAGGLNAPGIVNYYFSTPDSARNRITGDIDVRFDVTTDWTPTANQAVVAKWVQAGNQRSYLIEIEPTGVVTLSWSTDGSGAGVLSATSTVAVTPDALGRQAVWATLDVNDGANSVVTFYTAPTMESTWTQLGAQVTGVTTSIFAGSAPITIGLYDGSASLFTGTVHSVQVRDGINGPPIAIPQFDQLASGGYPYTFYDSAGVPWALTGSDAIYIQAADPGRPTSVAVYRVDATTGERLGALRPYVCYDGDCLPLSCGIAVFWDTEAPLDVPIYYETVACPTLAPCTVVESFTRVETSTWDAADTGQVYAYSGALANFNVDGAHGTMDFAAALDMRTAALDTGTTDQDSMAIVRVPALATGGSLYAYLLVRATDVDNGYTARLEFDTSGDVTLRLLEYTAGSGTLLTSSLAVGTYVANQLWAIHFRVVNDTLLVNAWPFLGGDEPTGWQVNFQDATHVTGTFAGPRFVAGPGNTNVPLTVAWDQFTVCTPCADPEEITGASPLVTVNSSDFNGSFFLKDPVRPCNDREIYICAPSVRLTDRCGGSGITFVTIGTELYRSNSTNVRAFNRRSPIASTRKRSTASTALRLTAVSFQDLEDLKQLLIPGSPLLFQGPPDYGVPDRYMDVHDLSVDHPLPNLTVQVRSVVLPYDTVDAPSGPTQGICGNRTIDTCDTYSELESQGFTYEDIITGLTSGLIGGS